MLDSGFQSPRFRIPQAKKFWIPESGFPYMGRIKQNELNCRDTAPFNIDFNIDIPLISAGICFESANDFYLERNGAFRSNNRQIAVSVVRICRRLFLSPSFDSSFQRFTGAILTTGGPSSLHERGRDSCLRAVICYKRLITKACMGLASPAGVFRGDLP